MVNKNNVTRERITIVDYRTERKGRTKKHIIVKQKEIL